MQSSGGEGIRIAVRYLLESPISLDRPVVATYSTGSDGKFSGI
jgi:hypothetical protein